MQIPPELISHHVGICSPAAGGGRVNTLTMVVRGQWMTYVFTQGSASSKPNSQSTPDTFPDVSPNCRHSARGGTTLPPFIAGNKNRVRTRLALGWTPRLNQREYRHQTVSIHDGTSGLKHAVNEKAAEITRMLREACGRTCTIEVWHL